MLSNLRVQPRLFSLVKAGAQKFEGSSRRAINYFPGSGLSPKSKGKLDFSNEQPILPQLVSIEAAKLSGCIKMESRRFKSRAAVLIYKGQVIACVYGSKAHPEQVFGTDGYVAMMSEISSVHSDVSSYVLDEKMVLSAASMFHGEVFNTSPEQDSKLSLSGCMKLIEELSSPGSIAVADNSGRAVCLLYLSGSSLLGINSLHSAVSEKDIRSIWQYLKNNPQAKIMANSFAPEDDSIDVITFSMLSQSAQRPAAQSRAGVCSVTELAAVRNAANLANLVGAYSVKPVDAAREVRSDRFISQRNLSAKQARQSAYVQSSSGINSSI
jgi:hypothetical protein